MVSASSSNGPPAPDANAGELAALEEWPRRQATVLPRSLGPERIVLPAAMRDQIVAHARAAAPAEACGLIIGDRPAAEGGRAVRWEPTRNRLGSAVRYEIDPDDLLRLTITTDDADEVFWAIVHSHTHSPAVPSATDIGLAFYPDALYVLVSLAPDEADRITGRESLRAWRILDGTIQEIPVGIED